MNCCSSANSTISSKRRVDLALGEAEHDAVDEDVLAAGNLRMESGAELDERRDAALHLHGAGRRLGDAGDELQRGALARSVAPDDAVGAPGRHVERHALQRRKRLVGLQVLDEAAGEQRALQRRELLPPRILAIDLGDVGQLNRVHGVTLLRRTNRAGDRTGSTPNRNSTTEPTPSASSHFQWPKPPGRRYRIS